MQKRFVLFFFALPIFLAGAAVAGPWEGKILEKNGVRLVQNPATPMEDPLTLTLEEAWRLGGESEAEGEFFGVIGAVSLDPDGNVYLLDRQLSEVKVFSPGGDYLRTIGREGEGPGEFRRPSDMFFTPEGDLAVLQTAPGRLVLLTPEGDPAGDLNLTEEDGGFRMLMGGESAGGHMVLSYVTARMEPGKRTRSSVIASFDSEGTEKNRYFEQENVMNFAKPVVDETKGLISTWAVGPDGKVYVVSTFGEYEIQVWDPKGPLLRVQERDFEHLKRTPKEKEDMKKRFVIRGMVKPEIVVAENEPDVGSLHPREDGTLWVLTSRGRKEKPENALGVFDVFDAEGRFVRKVTLVGQGNPGEDAYYLVGDHVFVATQYTTAMRSMFGGSGEEDEESEVEEMIAMEVICYRLPPLASLEE